MCPGSRGRRDINEHMKSSEPDKQYHAWLFFFFSLYMYLSYIFYSKECTIITTEKQKAKQIQKKIQIQVASNSNPEDLPEAMSDREKWRETVRDICADGATWWWWWCPSNKTKFSFFSSFFFQLVLNLHPYLLVPFIIKGREPPRSSQFLFIYFLFLSLLLAKNKSLSSSSFFLYSLISY